MVIGPKGANLARFLHPDHVIRPEEPHLVRLAEQRPGADVRVTPTVREFARQFEFKKPNTLADVRAVVDAVRQQIRPAEATREEAMNLYAQRTADDILYSRRALVLGPEERRRMCDVRGCVDYGIALVATLRALKVPADFARRGQRTLVFFKFGDKEYYVEPVVNPEHPNIKELSPLGKKVFASKAALGGFARGNGAWSREVNMTSMRDFDRHTNLFDQGNIEASHRRLASRPNRS